jgi:hypothetical protein
LDPLPLHKISSCNIVSFRLRILLILIIYMDFVFLKIQLYDWLLLSFSITKVLILRFMEMLIHKVILLQYNRQMLIIFILMKNQIPLLFFSKWFHKLGVILGILTFSIFSWVVQYISTYVFASVFKFIINKQLLVIIVKLYLSLFDYWLSV